ncbi:MAG: GHKL domain-containing protein [Coriobacteriia bacterium]|nr:GHKL domain-containing protein [Coriobacteriia bacterium]
MNQDRIRRISQFVWLGYIASIFLLVIVLIGVSSADRNNAQYYWTELREVNHATVLIEGQPPLEVELPYRIDSVLPGDKITVLSEAYTLIYDNVLFRVNGASLDIYVDDVLFFATGQPNTYPWFQGTPSPQISMLDLPTTDGIKQFRFEYTVGQVVTSIELSEFFVGDSPILFIHMLQKNMPTFIMAFAMFMAGLVLLTVSLMSMRTTSAAAAIAWLGFGCLAFGLWNMCANDLAVYFIPLRASVYTLTHIAMLAVISPLTIFYRRVLDRPDSISLRAVSASASVLALSTMSLHLTGAMPFAVTGSVIRLFVPAAMIVLGALIVRYYLKTREDMSRRISTPSVILAVFSCLDIISVMLGRANGNTWLQVGFIVFTVWMSIFGGNFVNQRFNTARQSERLAIEVEAMTANLQKQRELSQRFTETAEQVRAMRHDMRHQLSALRGYIMQGQNSEALSYIDQLEQSAPSYNLLMLTDNFAVNAVISFYLAIAEANDITTDLQMVVPADLGQVNESDLSIIFGNLFENAIEASLYLPKEQRAIKIRSQVVKGVLTITVDNVFDGAYEASGGVFYSRKRTGKGIGISSVQTIVDRYDGTMKIDIANNQFMVSLMIKL